MDKDKELSLRRTRSIQAALSDGYRLFAANFWRLVRSSWIQAVAYAVAFGGTMAYFFTFLLPRLLRHEGLMPQLAVWLGLLLVFAVAVVLFAMAAGVAPLRQHAQTDAIGRPHRWWGLWPWRLTGRAFTRLPRMLGATVRAKRLGALLAVLLVVWLVVLIATILLMLPGVVLTIANVNAQVGVAAGDVLDMPHHLFWLNFATFSVCGLLQAYIHLSTLFPLYYIGGAFCQKQ